MTHVLESPEALTDAALALRVAAGEGREVEAELCRRFAPRARLFGLRHLRSEAAAVDLAQAVLLRVLEALRAGRLREPERLGAFVLSACRQGVVDAVRAERRRAAARERFAPELAPAPAELPYVAGLGLDLERLRGCVERLAARARTVVALSFYAERSGEEVAEELGTTPGNVRVIRHRALAQLQACMGLALEAA
jgi:RNA polymerase sigma-70 factor (ECF subfamily)